MRGIGKLCLFAALALGGCATTTTAPEQQPDPTVPLDVGTYPTTVQAPPTSADPAVRHKVAEGHALAASVVAPGEVDPAFSELIILRTVTLFDPESLAAILMNDDYGPIAADKKFDVGFASTRQTSDGEELLNAAIRFPDTESAAAAAEAMTTAAEEDQATPVEIPNHPTTHAFTYTTDAPVTIAITPVGDHVVYQRASANRTAGPSLLAEPSEIIAKTLDLQLPRLDHIVHTRGPGAAEPFEGANFLDSHTLPASMPTVNNGLYPGLGAIHFLDEPAATATALSDAQVSLASIRGTVVYRAPDNAMAQQFASARSDILAEGAERADGVNGLAAARCFDRGAQGALDNERFHCLIAAGQYAAEAASADLDDAHQKLTAQYALLTT